ncbi:STAS domain-containing protein [Cellulomonas shaoxiangyii]|uniref:STAS domain-containing protein n=1 Tax=Cellulomonas shaoxiangyii TaxID=2566013 RepID=UPI0014097D10|nr:STAS domain-containing protein [Cellulomonas shaoxiangyii]
MTISPSRGTGRQHALPPSCTVVAVPGPVATLRLAGELDRDGSPAVEAALRSALPAEAPAVLRVDLGDLWFVDIEGVRMLARVHRAATDLGGQLELLRARPFLREIAADVAPGLRDVMREADADDGRTRAATRASDGASQG